MYKKIAGLVLLSVVIHCSFTQKAFALDKNLLPAKIPETPQILLPIDKDGHSAQLPSEMEKRDKKASASGWHMLLLQGMVLGISSVVHTECQGANEVWVWCPDRHDRQSSAK